MPCPLPAPRFPDAGDWPCRQAALGLFLHALVSIGDTERAEHYLAGLGERYRDRGEMHIATAVLRLGQHDPHPAAAPLSPVLDGSPPLTPPPWLVPAFLLEASAPDTLADPSPPPAPP